MKQTKQTYFRDEIRRSLIVHSLVPCVISLVALLLILVALGYRNTTATSNKLLQYEQRVVTSTIDDYAKKNKQLARSIDVQSFQASPAYKAEVLSGVYLFLESQPKKAVFYLFDQNRELIYAGGKGIDNVSSLSHYLQWYQSASDENAAQFSFIYENLFFQGRLMPALFFVQQITGQDGAEGYCAFLLNAESYYENVANPPNQSVLISNRFDRVFGSERTAFQDSRGKLRAPFSRNNQLMVENGQWYYVLCKYLPDKALSVSVISECTWYIQLCMGCLVTVLVLTVVLAIAIYYKAGKVADQKTQILYQLTEALDLVEKGNLDTSLHICTGDEFEHIADSFNMMIESIRNLLEYHEALTYENMQVTARTLESQFHPHFLFNSLESLKYLIRQNPAEAEQMLIRLSRLLRYTLGYEREFIPLGEELDFTEKYLQIMQCRYGKKLCYRLPEAAEVHQWTVPRMCVQPLVENAIKHGFGWNEEPLCITISVAVQENTMQLCVSDNGVGIPPHTMDALRQSLAAAQNTTEHIGLYNLNKRIQMIYGKESGVTLQNHIDKGVTVCLKMVRSDRERSWPR